MENQGFKLKKVVGFERILMRGVDSSGDFLIEEICKWLLKKLYPWKKFMKDM